MDLVAVVLAVEEELQAGNYNKSELILVDDLGHFIAFKSLQTQKLGEGKECDQCTVGGRIMKNSNSNSLVFVCKTDDNKKIYYDKSTNCFQSKDHSERSFGAGMAITVNLTSYSFFRKFDHFVLDHSYTVWLIISSIILGSILGVVTILLCKLWKSKKKMVWGSVAFKKDELKDILLSADVQLDQNQGGIFFFVLIAMFGAVFIYFDRTSSLLVAEAIVMSLLVYHVYAFDLKARKKLYTKLKKEYL